jgi:hypothetical protein
MLGFLVFLCCLDFGVWIIELNFSPFSLFFPHLSSFSLFFFFFFPSTSFLWASCLVALPRYSLFDYATSRPRLVASSCCLVLLPATTSSPCPLLWRVALLPLLQVVLLPLPLDASYYLVAFHFLASIAPQVPSNTPPFVASLPCCLTPHSLIALLPHYLALVDNSFLPPLL